MFSVYVTAALLSLATPPICAPSAQVVGAESATLIEALQRRDVRVPPAAGCSGVTVEVTRNAQGVTVRRPPAPPRTVPDIATAALLVETWVRAELIDPLLSARRPPPMAPAASVRPFHVGGGLDVAVTDDGASWVGGSVAGCLQLGLFCPGVRLRTLFDGGDRGESRDSDVTRLSLGVLVTGDLLYGPLRAGVGVGATTVRVDSKEGEDDDVGGAPLFEAHLGYSVRVADTWTMDISLSGDRAVWPRRGRGRVRGDDLPGQPRWAVIGGLGVRWSGQ